MGAVSSLGPLTFLPDGLGLLTGPVCPHPDSEPGRRPAYRPAVAEACSPPAGHRTTASAPPLHGRRADGHGVPHLGGLSRVEADGSGGVTERPSPCRTLTGGPTR